MNGRKKPEGKYMGTVKMGPKGQIVIPKEIRDMFGFAPGDSILILADAKKGVALERLSVFAKIADAILDGHGKELYPDHTEESSIDFANYIHVLEKEEPSDDSDSND